MRASLPWPPPVTTPSALLTGALLLASAPHLAAQSPWEGLPAELQIRLAVQAAPGELQAGATVQGWDAQGALVTLRQGRNGLVCMAPNPAREDLEVSCHHEGLEPFFARGRELTAEGVDDRERVQRRWTEYTEGTLPIPYGAVNYILTGSSFDPATGEIEDRYLRWTVYTPNATTETTGISERPSAGGPWLMFAGTPGSHIMITPPRGR